MANQAKWRAFSEEQIREIVASSRSNREVAKKLGYSQEGGGTMKSLHKMYEQLNIDTSHFTGQGWNKNNYQYDIMFTSGSPNKNGKNLSKPLISLRGRQCENCGITEWQGQPINLQVHHIDGNRLNNQLANLQLLCPNCHSYTDNFCKRLIKKKTSQQDFVNSLRISKNIRQALINLGLTASSENYTRARELMAKYNITFDN